MIKRLSDDVRPLVLSTAAGEARRRGDRRLGTEHLLLGLLHDDTGPVAAALGVSLESARAALDALDRSALAGIGITVEDVATIDGSAAGGRPPLSSGARAVFKAAIDRARADRTARITAEHFLLALLDCKRPDPVADLLGELGVEPAAARAALAD